MFLTVIQAAAILGLTPGRVRHFIADGRLRSKRVGPMYLVREADLAGIEKFKRGRKPK
jgi:excisionase family DNA binding protein